MPLSIQTPPANVPIDLDELKAHLNLEGTDRWDTLLTFFINAAVGPTEQALGQQLITASLQWTVRSFSWIIELPRPPLQSVTSVEYRTTGGEWITVGNADYQVNTAASPGFVRFNNGFDVPDTFENEEYPWRLTYLAGYSDAEGTSTYTQVPAEIRHWMMNFIGTAFMKREADVISMGSVDVVRLKAQMARLIKGHNKNVRFG